MLRSMSCQVGRFVLAASFVSFATSASAAQADCSIWRVGGSPVVLRQSDGASVRLAIGRNDSTVSGRADYFRSYVGKTLGVISKGVDVNMVGKVDGVLDGQKLDFKISWGNRSTGIYKLRIDAFGRIAGTSYDFENPSNRVNIVGDKPLLCFRR